MDFAEILVKLLDEHPDKGCSDVQIASLQERHRVALPEDYAEFLSKVGLGASSLWRGSDYAFCQLDEIQHEAKSLLLEAGLELPEKAFVFLMHQGYQFFFIDRHGVFFFTEGNKGFNFSCNTFSEFLSKTIDAL